MVVLAIIGIIAAIAGLKYAGVFSGVSNKMQTTRLSVIAEAQSRFRVSMGKGRYASLCELAQTTSNTGEKLLSDKIAAGITVGTYGCTYDFVDGWKLVEDTSNLRNKFLVQLVNQDLSLTDAYCISEDGVLRKGTNSSCSRTSPPVK